MPGGDPRSDRRPPAIALMGPTASGKTDLAIAWRARWPLEIVSVDSALVYRGLDLGSAKPDPETLRRHPHRLVDVREPHQPYSAAAFAADAEQAMAQITAAGRIPLLVGGTGLYFRALLRGLSPMPESDPALRARIAAEAAERGWEALHAELRTADPAAAAKIRPSDPQRISRALEVLRSSGRPLSAWQRQAPRRRFPWRVLKLAVVPPRELLHRRIGLRLQAMVDAGLLAEVERLLADPRLHPELPAMRAVGYRQAIEHLRGESTRAEFLARAIAATRQLAKRQLTWLRGELDTRWLDPQGGDGPGDAVALFLGTGDAPG